MSSGAQDREGRKRAAAAAQISPQPEASKRQKAEGEAASGNVVKEASVSSDYKHRIGSAFVGYPKWQFGESTKPQLSKAQKRVVGMLKDLCKRKGGQFFSRPVDPVDQELDDYFDIVADPLDLGTVIKSMEEGYYCAGRGGLQWHERVGRDVEQVWTNALLYNPAGNIVSEAATELRESFCQQLGKIVDESQESDGPCDAPEMQQLVMDDFVFRDKRGRLIELDTLLERGFAGIQLSGLLVRNRGTTADRTEKACAAVVKPESVYFDHLESMDGMTGAWVIVWIRTTKSWIRLLNPHSCWERSGKASLERLRLSGLVCKSFTESSRDAPERIIRTSMRAAMSKSANKAAEDRIHSQLLEGAEYTSVCIDRAQAADDGRIAFKDSKKLNKKLLQDAEKERSKKLLALLQGGQEKEAASVCAALAGVISRVQADSIRTANAEGSTQSPGQAAEKKRQPASASKLVPNTATPGKRKPASTPVKEKEVVVTDPSNGYWERDAHGVRRWVSNSGKEEVAQPGGKGGKKKRVEEMLAENPLNYEVGARVRVLFDDQQWYVGIITAYDESTKLFHVEFGDNDVDDIAMPDPDVVLVYPVDILVQAVDEAAEAFRRGLKTLLQDEIGKDLHAISDDLRKKLYSQHRSYKEVLQRTLTGKIPEENWTVQGVKSAFNRRMQAKFVEVGIEDKQWAFLSDAAARCEEVGGEGLDDEGGAEEPKSKGTPREGRGRKASTSATPAAKKKQKEANGSGAEVENAKSPVSESQVDQSGAAASSKKGKRRKTDDGTQPASSKQKRVSMANPPPEERRDAEEEELEKQRSDWSATPDWLKKNAMLEVLYEDDWWQAKAVKCVNGKVRCNYVGSEDYEWIAIDANRMRPPSEDWDKVISGGVGEMVEVKRKPGARGKWLLATVVELEEKQVKVQFVNDGAEEWVTLDANTIRSVVEEEEEEFSTPRPKSKSEAARERKERRPVVRSSEARWPEAKGKLSKWDAESVGACLTVKHFLSVFGKAPFLSQDRENVEKSTVTLGTLQVVKMLETMGDGFKVAEWIVAYFVRALTVLVQQDSGTVAVVLPDSLNWMAWLQRLLERDALERGRRMLRDRLEESYVSEEALADNRIPKTALATKGKRIQLPDPTRPYEDMHGEEVCVQGGALYGNKTITGHITADLESGVRIVCSGVSMTISDFLKFHEKALPHQEPPRVKVKREECTLEEWEANLKKEKATEDDGAASAPLVLPNEGDGNDHHALEALLGTELFKKENELLAFLSKWVQADWEDVPLRMRWRAAVWLCDSLAETDILRSELHDQGPEGDRALSTITGWTLFLAKKGGMKNAKDASEQWKANEATRAEYNEKARTVREQEQQNRTAKDAKRDAAVLAARQEALGTDDDGRRYWWGSWLDAKVAVEQPAQKEKKSRANPYPTAGGSRMLPFDEDPEWDFYDSNDELDMIEHFLDEEDYDEGPLLKDLRNERAASEAQMEEDPTQGLQTTAPEKSAPQTQTEQGSGGVKQISVLPAAPPGLATSILDQSGASGSVALVGGTVAMGGDRKLPANVLEKFPHRGEYFAKEDETPIGIAELFGVDTDALVEINKSLYAGLHSRARFKAGTLLILPAPTVESLGRSPVRPREHVLSDTIALLMLRMQVVPLALSISSALQRLARSVRGPDGDVSAVVDALSDLEHILLLPRERNTEPRLEDRLLPVEWMRNREGWIHELEKAKTWSQIGLLLQEFHQLALTKFTKLRELCTTRWSFRIECQKVVKPGAPASDSSQQGLVLIPMKGEIVVYLRRGHAQHLDHYPQRPWDCVPSMPVASCIVEDTWFFKGSRKQPPFCALQLRPIFQGKALVGKQILVGELPLSNLGRRLPAVCWVVDFREAVQQWLPLAPGMHAGPGAAPQTPQKVFEYSLRWDTGEPDSWVCLDRAKYQLVRPDEAGPSFFVTVHHEQVLPEFLVAVKAFRESEKSWTKGTAVRMFWRDEGGGEYYTGEVLEVREGEDPWDSVRVRWDRDGDDDWVCPWELQVWTGPRVKPRRRPPQDSVEEEVPENVLTTQQQVAALQPTGVHVVENDDETANEIAQMLGVDAELLVQMNKGTLSGLTKHAKLHKKTRLRIPPEDLRFERHTTYSRAAPSSSHIPVLSAQRMFNPADEVWWHGPWTDQKLQSCQVVLRKVMRHRYSSDFLEPVDHEGLGLDDYLEVVKQPMDLGTVAKKMDAGEYGFPGQFRADVVRVFENAKLYNPVGEREHHNAVLMLDMFEETWREEKERPETTGRRRF